MTQANLTSTICRKGVYTSGIRPSAYVTGREKRLNAASYGNTNLWVEPADPGHRWGSGVNNKKDPVETKLHTAVCKRQVTLSAARQAIVTDWTTALSSLHLG